MCGSALLPDLQTPKCIPTQSANMEVHFCPICTYLTQGKYSREGGMTRAALMLRARGEQPSNFGFYLLLADLRITDLEGRP